MNIRIFSLASLAVALIACGPSDVDQAALLDAPTVGSGSDADLSIAARLAGLPDTVLDGTEVTEISGLQLLGFEETAAGEYTVEQGGAVLAVSLARTADGWQLVRTHSEPGWPAEEASYVLQQQQAVLRSSDGNVMVVLCAEGLLVLEKDVDVVPPDLWVLYRRAH